MAASCSLDVADAGPHTLEEVSILLGITRERVRQLEEKFRRRLKSDPNLFWAHRLLREHYRDD
jgi:DNA-directed RNA polymerase sigma subunit (sigma70/sigma32)